MMIDDNLRYETFSIIFSILAVGSWNVGYNTINTAIYLRPFFVTSIAHPSLEQCKIMSLRLLFWRLSPKRQLTSCWCFPEFFSRGGLKV